MREELDGGGPRASRRPPGRDGVIKMKAFLLACLCAIALAVVAAGVLNGVQKPAAQAFATTGVRL
ncbi:hypothetical protein [Bradyrhizobium sp. WD16]|uniref:hypothetical protein n=1 Tax=Bradyrhizobium sp. WD16 TaxID=1521768 RepID=UPI0020A50956|nr:hypothetical protein [Bradyrhizobium sp. WD16]